MIIDISMCSINSKLIKEYEEERKLYKEIVITLLKNKDKIKYVETKKINNELYYYFKFKEQDISVCEYSFRDKESYNLEVGEVWFHGCNSYSTEYIELCRYLYDIGFSNMCEEKRQEEEINNKHIKRLKDTVAKLKI